MSELHFLISQLKALEYKYGYINLKWKIETKNESIAIISRCLSHNELSQIILPDIKDLSTTQSYAEILVDNNIVIWCVYSASIIIPISVIEDLIRSYTRPMIISRRMTTDILFV